MMHRIAAIGTFDGVHKGHRSVLKKLTEYANAHDMEPIAVTFDRHPLALIDPSRTPLALTSLSKKEKLLEEEGAKPLILHFDEPLRSTTARRWMRRLHEEYGVRAMVIGYDNTFGSDGLNLSLEDYRKLGEEEGITVMTADEVPGVSSSSIRKAVSLGDIEKANEMLGRPYSITSKVMRGNNIGHTIGFPTANVEAIKGVALPKAGVYAALVRLPEDKGKHLAMVNVGKHPTVMCEDHPVVEAHLLDWNGDLYDKEITVSFLKRIRDEIKFDSIEQLKEQLIRDKETVRNLGMEY